MPITTAPPAPPAPPVPTPQPSPNESPRETPDPVAGAAAEIARAAQAMGLPVADLAGWLLAAVRHGPAD